MHKTSDETINIFCVGIYETGNSEEIIELIYFNPDIGKYLKEELGKDISFKELKKHLTNAEEQELNYTVKPEIPPWCYGINRRQWGKVDSLTETYLDSTYKIVQKKCPDNEELMESESGLFRRWSNRASRCVTG